MLDETVGIGMILSVLLCGAFLDWYLKLKSVYSLNQAGDSKPEHRLPPMLLGTRHNPHSHRHHLLRLVLPIPPPMDCLHPRHLPRQLCLRS